MTEPDTKLNAPLRLDEDGTIRINGSRVSLDSIIEQFKLGATAEQIQEDFPTLTLREIYGAIYYYLDNTEAAEEYLRQQESAAEETRRFIDEHLPADSLRERLRARRQQMVNN
ncbi:MAG: hypothetical protein QOC96_2739 [Acidobacteriota bacterium]|jgi:uncharacterized protein (DUF433 family)|nr:hypothetical protein [Acidobacteriota bacterium]